MHFGFALELTDIDLWNTDLLDTHLDFLSRDKYTDIPSNYFVCLHKIFKRSWRHVFKTSSRRFQRNNFSSSKTSSRRLGKRKIVTLKTCWRRLQDQQIFPGYFLIFCFYFHLLFPSLLATRHILQFKMLITTSL